MSTVKDTRDNVAAFVRRNLSAGADHMYVFLDGGADDDVEEWLSAQEDVTVVRTDTRYWQGQRPNGLNLRQMTNANLVNVLLAALGTTQWLFHIDGDECLDIDQAALDALPADVSYVRLNVLEAVARRTWEGEVTHFKRALGNEDLCLLHVLGVIDEPDNLAYFNGHTEGKAGIRPSPLFRLRIHTAHRTDGGDLPGTRRDRLNVLHYESYSADEFARKWATHLTSGGGKQKRSREILLAAVASVVGNAALSADDKRRLLDEIFTRRVEDDYGRLLDLGLLVSPQPPSTRPRQRLGPGDREAHDALLGQLCALDRSYFLDRSGAGLAAALDAVGSPRAR